TSVERVLRTTGTVIAEGFGGAVSAAIWAGERICRAAAQPTSASPTSTANTRTAVRLLLPEIAEMARIRAPLGPHRGRDKANTARGGSLGERGLFSPIGLVGISPALRRDHHPEARLAEISPQIAPFPGLSVPYDGPG